MIENEVRNQEIHIMGLTHLPYEGCSICDDKRAKDDAACHATAVEQAIAQLYALAYASEHQTDYTAVELSQHFDRVDALTNAVGDLIRFTGSNAQLVYDIARAAR